MGRFPRELEFSIKNEIDIIHCSKALLVGREVVLEFKQERTLDEVAKGTGRDRSEDGVVQTELTHNQIELWVSSLYIIL